MAPETSTPARELLSDAPTPQYTRFTLADRAQHLVMLLSFTTLAITGLVQKVHAQFGIHRYHSPVGRR